MANQENQRKKKTMKEIISEQCLPNYNLLLVNLLKKTYYW